MKGRTCADGRAQQRSLYEKAQTTSPTVSNNALVISIIKDACEGRDVGVSDIAGAYLKADMDDFVVMKVTGEAVRILCEMNPAHKENVTIENGIETLFAICGPGQSTLWVHEIGIAIVQPSNGWYHQRFGF